MISYTKNKKRHFLESKKFRTKLAAKKFIKKSKGKYKNPRIFKRNW